MIDKGPSLGFVRNGLVDSLVDWLPAFGIVIGET